MIELKNLSKSYGDKIIYTNFNLKIEDGETVAILGNSGCGKTTLLNIMANLTDFNGEVIGIDNPSFVFAEDRLLPHKTVKENLLFVNKVKDVSYMLEKVGLKEYENAYPKELSTGMARRVSVLRAFCYDSSVMLLDEPFRNLDLALKYKLMDFFLELKKVDKKTAIFVTHDPDEAVYIADRVIVLEDGNVVFDERIKDREESFNNLKKILIKK
ncbi:MAG: ATP-binding cassette domain-containing protein [Clostridiales bacterium]|nr:ATP-binding cassette domain-containing protein [Clostridiales bacterium]